ncbi:MAG: hypothetical protein ACYCZN_01645 [Candidatus Dormibacteria bacterium]
MMGASDETVERRARLRRLDDILEALEQLNLSDAPLSERVRRSLAGHGIPVEDGVAIRVLIERVWRKQERYMLIPFHEQRRISNRRSVGRHCRDDVVEGLLRQGQASGSEDRPEPEAVWLRPTFPMRRKVGP